MRGISAVLAGLIVSACGSSKPNVTVGDEAPGIVRPYLILKTGRDTTTKGWPGSEFHVALAPALSNADQRATLQHVIDSVIAKDTSVLWLRVTAFAPDKAAPGAQDVPLSARLQAIWAPPDTSDPGSRSHKAVHRTYYTVIAPEQGKAR